MVLPAKVESATQDASAPASPTCFVETEEGAGVNGNLLCFILFMGLALVMAELVTETVFRPKFLFLAVVAAGIALVSLQDSWLQRRPRFYRLVLETPQGREVVLESSSRESVEAAERTLRTTLGQSQSG